MTGIDVEDHPLRTVAAVAERVDHLQPLGRLQTADLAGVGLHHDPQLFGELLEVDAGEELLDRLGAHPRLVSLLAELVAKLAETLLASGAPAP